MNEKTRLYVLMGVLAVCAVAAALYWTLAKPLGEKVDVVRTSVTGTLSTWCCTETGYKEDGPAGRGPKKNPHTGKDTMYSSFAAKARDASDWRVFVQYTEDNRDIESMMACPEGGHPDGRWLPYRNPDTTLLGFRTPDGKPLQPAEAPRYVKPTEE
jgi:hypothetical protein